MTAEAVAAAIGHGSASVTRAHYTAPCEGAGYVIAPGAAKLTAPGAAKVIRSGAAKLIAST